MKNLLVIGVDEVGRGCLAGPVVAGAYLFTADPPKGVKDSKKLSTRQRQALLEPLAEAGLFGIGVCSASEVDEIGIQEATFEAMRRALAALPLDPVTKASASVVIDGNQLPRIPGGYGSVSCLVQADATVPAVSAASIVAKEHRDDFMRAAALQYPDYQFDSNAGYLSASHAAALETIGHCPLHRVSFEPLRSRLIEPQLF